MRFRIGQGYDVHRLVEGRRLVICGVEIPNGLGLLGHSDADVAIHALCDALLGALAFGDIGSHFPDTDAVFKDIDSTILLLNVVEEVRKKGWEISNVDVTIVAQKPKLRPYIDMMRQRLSDVMAIPVGDVSVKATTTERLGFEGRMEGISATAVALLHEPDASVSMSG